MPTLWDKVTKLLDRSPHHMLPYPTHAHPLTSSHGHAYSQPNPNDHNFQKYHGRLRLASPLKNVHAHTHVWCTTIMKIIT